jgi:hypothetical protein
VVNEGYIIRHTMPNQSEYNEINRLTIDEVIEKRLIIYGKVVHWKIENPFGFVQANKEYTIFPNDFYTDTRKTDGNISLSKGTLVSFKIGRQQDSSRAIYAYSVVVVVNN